MSKTHNAGIVTAYGAAVRGGYTGTYEEFCAQQAQYAENARDMEQAVSDVRNIKTSVESAVSVAETHANNAGQSATNASNSATQASESASNANQSAENASQFANNASNSANSASQSATSAQTSANNASTSERNAQQSAEDAQDILESVQTEGNTQIGRVQAKGNEILNSLPDDFTEVQKELASLNGSLDTLSAFMNAVPVDTASGAVATFADGADNVPVKSLTVDIEPIQSGTGDPSPDNIRPISGWTGTTLTCNNEIINIDWTDEAGTVYSGTLDVTNGKLTVDMAMVDLGTLKWYYFAKTNPPHFGADVYDMKPRTNNLLCSNYATVKNNPNTNAYGTIRASEEHSNCGIKISDAAYTDTNAFRTAMSGVQLVYELANPITYQLTPQEVKTILGENNIFADTGDVSVEYRADIKKYIDKVVATAVSALS